LSLTTLWRLCRAGQFPQPVRIPAGRVAFAYQEIEDWMKARFDAERDHHVAGAPLHDGVVGASAAILQLAGSAAGPSPRGGHRSQRRSR
jgi:hypothetical protein